MPDNKNLTQEVFDTLRRRLSDAPPGPGVAAFLETLHAITPDLAKVDASADTGCKCCEIAGTHLRLAFLSLWGLSQRLDQPVQNTPAETALALTVWALTSDDEALKRAIIVLGPGHVTIDQALAKTLTNDEQRHFKLKLRVENDRVTYKLQVVKEEEVEPDAPERDS